MSLYTTSACCVSVWRATQVLPTLILFLTLECLAQLTPPGVMREYCQWESFNASCPVNHVIVMVSARYGRLEDGRCAKKGYGAIGCAADVIGYADWRCSGKRQCKITVADISLQGIRPCPQDLTSYFEASFTCIPVEERNFQQCRQSQFTKVVSTSGFILNTDSLGSVPHADMPIVSHADAPSSDCPWIIETDIGRRINLTLYDFKTFVDDPKRISHVPGSVNVFCRRLAVVKELKTGRETNICAGSDRQRHVYLSESEGLEINVLQTRREQAKDEQHFLIQYQVTGCRTPVYVGATVARRGDSVYVECNATKVRWRISCINSEWVGEVGNCTSLAVSEMLQDSEFWDLFSHGWTSSYGLAVVICLGILFGLVIGTLLLVITVCLIRWKHARALDCPDGVDPSSYYQTSSEDDQPYHHVCHSHPAVGYIQRKELIDDWQPDVTNISTGSRSQRDLTNAKITNCPFDRQQRIPLQYQTITATSPTPETMYPGHGGGVVPFGQLGCPGGTVSHFYESPIFARPDEMPSEQQYLS